MALPLLNTPEFETNVPSSNQRIKFRPFLVKEEKILFMALQGGDTREMTNAVQNIIGACVLTEGFDVSKLAMYDIEYLFLKLRGKSVGESIDLRMRHTNKEGECKHATEVSVNIDDISVQFPEGYDNKTQLTDTVGIKMRHPGIQHTSMFTEKEMDFNSVLTLISDCVECIYDHDNVYDSFTKDEIIQFIEGLNQQQFAKVQKFFTEMPKLNHKVEWRCPKCEEVDSITVEGLGSFFT
tara:strand:- start:842 stop:1555 length:714 start_codon:yes stop_codon:yes gene_type:complete